MTLTVASIRRRDTDKHHRGRHDENAAGSLNIPYLIGQAVRENHHDERPKQAERQECQKAHTKHTLCLMIASQGV